MFCRRLFLLVFGAGARRGYNGLTSFKSYLLAIAKNVVLGRFRKDVRRLVRFKVQSEQIQSFFPDDPGAGRQVDQLELIPSGQPSPADEYLRLGIRKLVEKCSTEFDEEQRQVLRLYYLNEFSQDATAAALSISRNKVRKHIAGIRKILLRELKKNGLYDKGALSFETME